MCGIGKEYGGAEEGIDGIEVAAHILIGAAEVVLGEGGGKGLAACAVVVGGDEDERVGGEGDVVLVVGLSAQQGVAGTGFAAELPQGLGR